MCIRKWSKIMALSGVGGPQGPQDRSQISNQNNVQQQVEDYKASIFDQCDTDKSGKLEAKNANGENEVSTFKALVDKFIAKITGGNKTEQTGSAQAAATPQDVQAATIQPAPEDNSYSFDNDGNVISDVKHNDDGSKDIKSGDETIHVSKNGDSISVKDESGRNVALTKTPDGGFEFTDEQGEKHKFDKDMNPLD